MLARTWTDVDELFRRIERDFADLFGRSFWGTPTRDARVTPPMEVLRKEGELVVRVEMPGVDPEKVDVTIEDNVLRIRADRALQLPEGVEPVRREFTYGTYERELALPEGTEAEKLSARYEAGILEITVPYQVREARKIPVEIGGSERKALAA
jgi:HSP20 family protein